MADNVTLRDATGADILIRTNDGGPGIGHRQKIFITGVDVADVAPQASAYIPVRFTDGTSFYLPPVQYTEGDVDTSITGAAMLWEDAGDTLRAVSAAKPLPTTATGNIRAFTDAKEIDLPLPTVTTTAYTNLQVMAWYSAGLTVRSTALAEFAWWFDHLQLVARIAGTFRVTVFKDLPSVASTIAVGTVPAINFADHGKIFTQIDYGDASAFDNGNSFTFTVTRATVPLAALLRFPSASTKIYFMVQSLGANATTGSDDFHLTGALALATSPT